MRPLIGITPGFRACEDGPSRYDLPISYGSAVTRAGGLPVLVAGTPDEADEWLARLDGLLLPGGGDVAPERYGAAPVDSADVCERRDELELTLARAFWQAGKPILGICRGIQVLNIALGGTLYQDISREMSILHPYSQTPCHGISILPGSRLYTLLGDARTVNSTHHQALRTIAPSLHPCAWSESGRIVEAVEAVDSRPVLAVQWHPERMIYERSMNGLFDWLVTRSVAYRPNRTGDSG